MSWAGPDRNPRDTVFTTRKWTREVCRCRHAARHVRRPPKPRWLLSFGLTCADIPYSDPVYGNCIQVRDIGIKIVKNTINAVEEILATQMVYKHPAGDHRGGQRHAPFRVQHRHRLIGFGGTGHRSPGLLS